MWKLRSDPRVVSRENFNVRHMKPSDVAEQLGVDSLWFQFESALAPVLTPWGVAHRLPDWAATWGSHPSHLERT